MRANRDSIAALLAVAAFLLVVFLGFWKTRGPGTQRLFRADAKRIQNIGQLANEISRQYRQANNQLPERLTDVQKTRYADPLTGRSLVYSPKPPSGFALCTTFATNSPKEEVNEAFAFWAHQAGARCFEFDATQAPQAPHFYY